MYYEKKGLGDLRKGKVKELNGGYEIVGDVTLGCHYCANGSKMVLFVTGI